MKYLALLAVAVLFTACFDNDFQHTFSDGDAYIAFPSATAIVNENVESGKVQVPIMLTSISNISGTATVVVDKERSTGVAGVNYKDPGEITVTFPGGSVEQAIQYVTVELIDNDVYTGNATIVLNITGASGNVSSVGAQSSCTVTVIDDEHPLKEFFGSRKITSTSETWSTTVDVIAAEAPNQMILVGFPISAGNSVYYDMLVTVDLEKGTAFIPSVQGVDSRFGAWDVGLYVDEVVTTSPLPGVVVNGRDIQFTGTWDAWFPAGTNAGLHLFRQTDMKISD